MKYWPRLLNLIIIFTFFFGAFGFLPESVEAITLGLVINEIDYDQPSTDTAEFIELKNIGTGPIDLDGYWLDLVNGATEASYRTIDLPVDTLAAGDYYVICANAATVANCDYDFSPDIDLIQNGSPDAVTLFYEATLMDTVSYEGDTISPYTEGSGLGLEDSSGVDGSIQRCPDGSDTNQNNVDFVFAEIPTPGSENSCVSELPEVYINEIRIDQPDTDNDEYFEIVGEAGTSLDGLTYLVIGDGTEGSGVVENVTDLTGQAIPSSGYFVAAESTFTLGTADMTTTLNFENSDNVTHLLVSGFTGSDGQDLDTDDDGELDSTPWSGLVDCVGLVEDPTSGEKLYCETLVGPDGIFVPGHVYRCEEGWLIGDFDLGTTDSPGAPNACTPPVLEVLINEVDADTPGTDTAEFLELFDGGVGSTSLDGLVLVFYNGSDDQSYQAFDLDGYSTDESGYFVVCGNATNVANCDLDLEITSDLIQNGADAIGLYLDDATNFPNDTPITTTNLLDAIVYDTDDSDDAALLVLLNSGQPQVNENGEGDKDNQSNQRCPNGSGGLRNTDTYTQLSPSPGTENNCLIETEVLINEVDADTPSTDTAEFLELYDGGVGSTSLDGLVLVFYNGSNDLSYRAIDLDGYFTDESGYFVVCGNAANVANCDLDVEEIDQDLIQNGADAIGLYLDDATNFPNDTPITTTNLLDAIVYDTDDSDDAALLVLLNSGQPQVNENGEGDKDNQSNQRCPNGSGGLRNTDTYIQFSPTPGVENCTLPPEACGDDFTPIYEIQGIGFSTPLSGTNLATEGIVVGDFQVGGKNGFFIQDMEGDGNPATSDGIFVFAPGMMDVNVGDHVRVRGTATEYFDLTQVGSVSQVWLCEAGVTLPEATELVLPVESADDFEQLEGMYVTIPQNLIIAEYFNFDRYGEIVLSSERFMTFTATNEPDIAGFAASEEEYFLSTITLDDGRTNQNPDPAIHPNGLDFTMENLFRGGDLVANVTGVMDYGFSLYRIQPTQGADYTTVNSRPDTLEIEEGTLKVASFNVLNYFTTIDTGAYVCGPVEFVDVIGKIGEDPGDFWGTDPKTQDQTLIRKPGICAGDWESIDDFDPVNEWDSLGLNYFDDLGSHTTTCISFDDLIISEYIEGSGNNKALEIYNGTGDTVDLRDYKVAIYFNGEAQEPSTMLTWDSETLLADGEVYVITNIDADAAIKAEADIILSYPSVAHFNGDDVVALMKAGPDGMECRGADTEEELIRQKDKILAAMSEIDADVFGLMEIENDRIGPPSDYAVADLVAGLNDIVGAGTYDYIATGAIGTDAIKVALLYKPASVTPVGDYEILDSTVDPRFIDTKNRPTLAQVFEDNLTGETFTVAVNHLKSKGSPCVDVGDPDLDDGAGNCNITRLDAAQAMVDWLADDTIFSEVDNVLIIGDLNSYDKEDPIDAIKLGSDDTPATDDDYFDMIYEILGEDAYGYVFDGKTGYLDYALASTSLMDNILDVVLWHINADEPDIIDYDMTFKQDAQDALYVPDKYRSSDHDPVIVSLRMNEGPTAVDDVYETDQDVTLNVPEPGVMENDSDPNPNDELWVDIKTGPSHGELTLNDDGSFTYIPDPGFFGVDTFEYYLLALPPEMRSDYMDIGLVTITVKPKYQFFFPLVINN